MRNRSVGLGVLMSLALVASACSSAATATPTPVPRGTPAATATPATSPTATPTPAPSYVQNPSLKIGVVTDVGTVNDKNFNQYSYEGAVGRRPTSAPPTPSYVVPNSSTDYAPDINGFVTQGLQHHRDGRLQPDQRHDQGGQGQPQDLVHRGRPGAALHHRHGRSGYRRDARRAPATRPRCCPSSSPSTTPRTRPATSPGSWPPASPRPARSAPSAASTWCRPSCATSRAIVLGAQSVNPSIQVDTGYVTSSDFNKAFNDPGTGQAFAAQFIQQKGDDVMFQVAGKTGNGVLQAACAAKIVGIGVDVDQYLSLGRGQRPRPTGAS